MRSRSNYQKRASSSSATLKSILKDIHNIQKRVASLNCQPQVSHSLPQTNSRRTKVKRGKKSTNSAAGFACCESITLEPHPSSAAGTPLKQGSTFSCVSRGSTHNCCIGADQFNSLPLSYVSLQFENIRLERENFNLERQLLQQHLGMERQQKRNLKNKLAKVEKNQCSPSTVKKTKSRKENDSTPIKIDIPALESMRAPRSTTTTLRQAIPALSRTDGHKVDEKGRENSDVESMLLSQGEEQKERWNMDRKEKENSQRLEGEFMRLLDQCQGGKKSGERRQMRQALGDIANRLKAMRQF